MAYPCQQIAAKGKKNNQPTESEMPSFITACGGLVHIDKGKLFEMKRWIYPIKNLERVIHRIKLPKDDTDFIIRQVDFDEVIGKAKCVPVRYPRERMLFAFNQDLKKVIPVVLNTERPPTKSFTVMVKKNKKGSWWLICGYYGERVPYLPNDPHFLKENVSYTELMMCVEYWNTHAFIHEPYRMGEPFVSTWEEQSPALRQMNKNLLTEA